MLLEESWALPPGSLLRAAHLLTLDMKALLQGVLAALESVEDDTRDGVLGLVGVLQLVRSESAPELGKSMGMILVKTSTLTEI